GNGREPEANLGRQSQIWPGLARPLHPPKHTPCTGHLRQTLGPLNIASSATTTALGPNTSRIRLAAASVAESAKRPSSVTVLAYAHGCFPPELVESAQKKLGQFPS